MTPLNRKLIRDLSGMKGQAAAICLVIASGVATFVMSLCTQYSLQESQAAYYDRHRFANVFLQLKRAPLSLADQMREIPGVSQVQARISISVTIDVEDLPEPVVGLILSTPDHYKPGLNEVYIRSGRRPEPGRGEVMVTEAFALAHQLEPGDSVNAVINGKRQKLNIVGVVLSPEYLIQIPPGSLLPDDKRYGVFWMPRSELEAAYDMDGAFNNATLALMRGASEEEVIQRVDELTAPYGGLGAYGREHHVSHKYISEEISQLTIMAVLMPSIFLGVAAMLLNVVMGRTITMQREQIAALKAFGYTRWEVGWHYMQFALLIVLAGDLLGVIGGFWLGQGITQIYTTLYRFPVLTFRAPIGVLATALVVSGGAAVFGTLAAVRSAVNLAPAEAMRPEPPADFRSSIVERLGLGRFLSPTVRMIVRQLERRPLKSATSVVGIALAAAILILGSFMEDSIDYLMDFQFNRAQLQDMTVTFVEPTSAEVEYEMAQLPGVLATESFRSVSTRMRFGHRHRRVAITGLPSDNRLYRLLDENENIVDVPPAGLMLSEKLAELLGANLGDVITVEVLEGERPVRRVPVTKLVKEYSGTNAYMNVEVLHKLMREGGSLSGTYLAVDSQQEDNLYTVLKNRPGVAGVSIKSAALESFRDTIAENMLAMRFFNIMFASIIAFGVVYNGARVSLSERSRELATLRVIGFTRAEISFIMLGELALLTLLAIPLGLAIGTMLAYFMVSSVDTDLYRFPLVVSRGTYGFAAAVVVVATLVSGLIVRRMIDKLDLIAVLKTKE